MRNNSFVEDVKSGLKDFISENEEIVKKGGGRFSNVEYYGRILLLDYFQSNGFFKSSNEKYSKAELIGKLKIVDKYLKQFDILLIILEKEGFITISGDTICVTDMVESKKLAENIKNLPDFKAKLIEENPDMTPHFTLLEACISNYKEILSGEIPANSVMFPVFSTKLVDGIFRGNMLADYFNNLIADSVMHYVAAAKGNGSKIKILEIGSGTGGTSAFVLDRVAKYGDDIEFYFTDISKIFVKNAEKKYKEKFPFAKFMKMNIEEALDEQGFESGSFDVIFASNVVHATKNIRTSLANTYKLLKDNGIFLLNEVTEVQDFATLTFGLMDGWWRFEDDSIRLPNSPLLRYDMWESVLKSEKFDNINCISGSGRDDTASFSQTLILAEK